MQIILARHGQTTANAQRRFQGHSDYPLNETGRLQAQQLAEKLAVLRPGRLFVSDLSRSLETAGPAARLLGLTPVCDAVFREYSWGMLEGLTWDDIRLQHPQIFPFLKKDLRAAEIPGQEHLSHFRLRLQRGLELLLDGSGPQTVALIGHGRYLNALVVEFLGLDFNGPWPFSFSSAAITVLEEGYGRRRLLLFNDQSHLTGEVNA